MDGAGDSRTVFEVPWPAREDLTVKKVALAGMTALAVGTALTLTSADSRQVQAQVIGAALRSAKAGTTPGDGRDAGNAAMRGRYIATAADCIACHTAPGAGKPFGGGNVLQTPVGKLVASNVTPDREKGIGGWTEADFVQAVRRGKGRHGEYLYPAMPYNKYVKISDEDMHDLWVYMQTVEPVSNKVVSNQLSFPFNIRLLMFGWNLLFFDDTPFRPDPQRSAQWNRGAYLVQGLAHCESCHTPKNFLGADRKGMTMQGATLAGWYAPEVTGNRYVGVGNWSVPSLVEYLKTGANDVAVAAGPMAEAVTNSTQYLSDADLTAMAFYLASLPGSRQRKPVAIAADDSQMKLGRHLYEVNCAACHRSTGSGVAGMIPALAGSASLQAAGTASLIRTVLLGDRAAITAHAPTGAAMPAFSWKLSDEQIAAVLTYSRNSWGNAASRVSAAAVKDVRNELKPPGLQ
jgi:mono/diheme cytochrome c family protein